MNRQRAGLAVTILIAALAIGLIAQSTAAGASTGTISLDVAGMVYWADADEVGSPPCQSDPVPTTGRLFAGTNANVGAMAENVQIPQGARVTGLKLSARDNDTDYDAYAYLIRKRLAPKAGLDGFQGYKILASVHTNGASGLLRRFGTSAISNPLVDESNFAYYAEIVNCANTVDPIGVQVVWSK